jgi:hypothetical protein
MTGFVQWLWSMSLTNFMRFWGFRGQRDRRNRERSAISLIIIAFVIAGAARCDCSWRLIPKPDKAFKGLSCMCTDWLSAKLNSGSFGPNTTSSKLVTSPRTTSYV